VLVPHSHEKSVKRSIRLFMNRFGIDVLQYSNAEWRWSYHVDDYYPVNAIPRWGYGNPPHPKIYEVLDRRRGDIVQLLSRFSQCASVMASVQLDGHPDSTTPYWKNVWFGDFDAAALVGMLVSNAPTRYFEIGSGNSTKFARHAIRHAGLATSITSLDPQPRTQIDALCDKVIRRRLEECDLSLFDVLEPGDILFYDGSHRIFENSDVAAFFLDLMPRLKPGVFIHIHDIFLPWDYPPEWQKRMYSEQYILAAMLLCPQTTFKVLLPSWFACKDPHLSAQVGALLKPFGGTAHGVSFWLEKV
jgi:hypothetical protein